MNEPVKRKRGRPSTGKRGSFTFRLRPIIRQKLIDAAIENKISVSEEIERRLEFSFHDEPVLTELRRFIAVADAIACHERDHGDACRTRQDGTTLPAHDNAGGDGLE
jgi:hypothetical protein